MIKYVCLAAGLVLVSSTAAQACAAGNELGVLGQISPWYDYSVYDQLNSENPFKRFTNIDLVKSHLIKVENTQGFAEDKWTVEFEVIRSLKGENETGSKFPYIGFRSDYANNNYLNTINPETLDYQQKNIQVRNAFSDKSSSSVYWNRKQGIRNYHKSVPFLDSFLMLPPRVNHQIDTLQVRSNGQCGPGHAEHVIPHDGTFIVFRRGDVVSLVEATYISKSKKSPLEEIIEAIAKTGSSPHLEVSLKEFVSGLRDYKVIETTHCNTPDERKTYIASRSKIVDSHLKPYQYSNRDRGYGKTDTLFEKYYSGETVPYSKVKNYFETINSSPFECKVGQIFLAVKSNVSNPKHTPPLYLDKREQFTWRFMRIEDDLVFADDLRTNMRIIGPKKVPLDDVLSK